LPPFSRSRIPVMVRALIVDDEPLARQRLRTLLKGEADIEVVGECSDGHEAVAAVRELRPDLLFLDVQMPVLDGFGVLEALGPEQLPAVIFVTAYDLYAIRAFEVNALDYLLKPFDRDRFRKALSRAREQITKESSSTSGEQLGALLEEVQTGRSGRPLERLVIKSGGRVFFLRAEEIDWIEAAGNYLRLHVGSDMHLLRDTMNNLEARLHPDKFLRIHRSTMVNLERVKELQPWFHGDYKVILLDGTELTLSRSYRPKLKNLLGESI
ncbi:MAG TPA: LytTR family transcriptional regulator DNA-binding domain-containing protein, partial [Gemmataceae bacterium]|nr:LytTR family transcriptional regulator DNA-binding domain-containing protein [Gemmataceae bacterium]